MLRWKERKKERGSAGPQREKKGRESPLFFFSRALLSSFFFSFFRAHFFSEYFFCFSGLALAAARLSRIGQLRRAVGTV